MTKAEELARLRAKAFPGEWYSEACENDGYPSLDITSHPEPDYWQHIADLGDPKYHEVVDTATFIIFAANNAKEIADWARKAQEMLAARSKEINTLEEERLRRIQLIREQQARLNFLREKGITVSYAKEADKEPYLAYLIKEGSELCDKRTLDKLLDAELENTKLKNWNDVLRTIIEAATFKTVDEVSAGVLHRSIKELRHTAGEATTRVQYLEEKREAWMQALDALGATGEGMMRRITSLGEKLAAQAREIEELRSNNTGGSAV